MAATLPACCPAHCRKCSLSSVGRVDSRSLDQPHAELRRPASLFGIGRHRVQAPSLRATRVCRYKTPDAWPDYRRWVSLAFLGFFGFFSKGSFSDPDLAKAEVA